MNTWTKKLEPLRARWLALAPREQRSVRLAGAVIGLAAVWWLLFAPALGTLHTAAREQPVLREQLQTMLRQQAQAQALQKQPRTTAAAQARALGLALAPLGAAASLEVQGDRAVVTLKQLPADQLASWLQQLHSQLALQPAQVKLQRQSTTTTWSGSLTFTLAATQ